MHKTRKRTGANIPNAMFDDGDVGVGCRDMQSSPLPLLPVVALLLLWASLFVMYYYVTNTSNMKLMFLLLIPVLFVVSPAAVPFDNG